MRLSKEKKKAAGENVVVTVQPCGKLNRVRLILPEHALSNPFAVHI